MRLRTLIAACAAACLTVLFAVPATAGAEPTTTVCRATPISLLGLTPATANPGENPCVTDKQSVAAINHANRPRRGLLDLSPVLWEFLRVGAIEGDTELGTDSASATADIAGVELRIPLMGYALNIKGVHSEATAAIRFGCDDAQLNGRSRVGELIVAGVPHDIGGGPEKIDLGIARILLNETIEEGDTITQRAVFIDLPGTALDIVLGETKAGLSC